VIYRKAEPADAPALAAFGALAFVTSYEHVMDRAELEAYVPVHFTSERQLAEINDPRITTYLALNPQITGYAQLAAESRPECALLARAPAELKRIYVDRTLHGHGVARKLLELVEADARRRGSDVLWLAVWEINDRAISFYRKSGFAMVGRQGFPIGNEVQSDHVMAKLLADELHYPARE
jgi:diamine N-acetyltransferase